MKKQLRKLGRARIQNAVAVAMLMYVTTASGVDLRFSFGDGQTTAGFTPVTPQSAYDATRGFGYLGGPVELGKPAIFAADVDEGNYDVTIRFGDPSRATVTTIKAEQRRLMVEKVETAAGEYQTRTFTVNVRRPKIEGGGEVSRSKSEEGPPTVANWDEHLTLEINGSAPGVNSIEIKPAADALTVYLAGDSTVTDQHREPWAGWGQMLPRYFQPGVAVSNHAWSGLTLTSFERQKRLAKILSTMKKGDYLFIQFGHNDQKEKAPAGPFTTYKANLKRYVEAARSKGGIPVLLTPMERRRWKDGQPEASLGDFAEAVRQVGKEDDVPVIDLNTMSLKLYAVLGEEGSKQAFVFYPANTFPRQREALKDNTHHNNFGGYELARCVVEGIKANVPELAGRLAKDAGDFDPAKPDDPGAVKLPLTPAKGPTETPAGS